MLSARIPVIEFRSLLSPPIRLPLRALHSLFRPQCPTSQMGARRLPQCLEQRRNLVLYKTAKAETVLGMHKLLPFDLYETPSLEASNHLVRLEVSGQTIEDMSLQDIYDKYIRPGQILYPKDGPAKKDTNNRDAIQQSQIHTEFRTYGIFKAETIAGNKKDPRSGKGQGALRVTPINLSSPAAYYKHAMDRSYQFLKHGSPVEFVIAITRKADKDKKKRLTPSGPDNWRWLHEHFPHLRPDFIIKMMPEGSRYVVDPVSDGKVIQFVLAAAPPQSLELGYSPTRQDTVPGSLTKRLMRVKASVQKSVREGRQAQLPRVYRQMLHDSGNMSYHGSTNMPITKGEREVRDRHPSDAEVAQDDAFSRYMPAKPQEKEKEYETPRLRTDKLNKAGELIGQVPQRKWVRDKDKKKELLSDAMSSRAGNRSRWEGRGSQHQSK